MACSHSYARLFHNRAFQQVFSDVGQVRRVAQGRWCRDIAGKVQCSQGYTGVVCRSRSCFKRQHLAAFSTVAGAHPCSPRRVAARARYFAQAGVPTAHEERVIPNVVFMLGGPGAGKSTQSGLVLQSFDGWAHISAGDCLREERNNPNSKDGELIRSLIDSGKFVPVAITLRLLQRAMAAKIREGKTSFLIDGYPRNMDNVTGWKECVADSALVRGVLFLNCREDVMERRLLQRAITSGRVDDDAVVIRARFTAFVNESLPILELYRQGSILEGKLFEVDGNPPIEDVWVHVKAAIKALECGNVQPSSV